ncbi:MAG: TIGR04500 family putative peptide maturation system protein, partial [Chloroflexi bacterium]|nr:TIGR04500 family putative peptide maturation system protein [Chloroflexota bacterium]
MSRTGPDRGVLSDTLAYLRRLAETRAAPPSALDGLSSLRARHPSTTLDLVWLDEAFDQSVHYDALIHLPGDGTVSLSYAPDGGLPWPLRGVHRRRDQDLAKVNNVVLTVDRAIAELDALRDEAPIARQLVDLCLIQEALQREPIALDEDELQQAMDAFRRARRLFTAEDTERWLADKGLTPESLAQLVGDQAALARLRVRIVAGRVEEYFALHRDQFTTLALLRLDFPDLERARVALGEARRGTSLHTLAQRGIAQAVVTGQKPPRLDSTVLRKRDVACLELLPIVNGGTRSDAVAALLSA